MGYPSESLQKSVKLDQTTYLAVWVLVYIHTYVIFDLKTKFFIFKQNQEFWMDAIFHFIKRRISKT